MFTGATPRIPSYRLHKTSGRAVVRLNGRDIYLGKHGTPESHTNYNRVISEWTSNFRQLPINETRPNSRSLTLCEIALPYLSFADLHYRKRGQPTSEVSSIKRAMKPLIDIYGKTEARNFGPLALKTYRDSLIAADLSRGVVNNHVSRIKRFFKWVTANEMVPSHVSYGLQCVAGFRYGRSAARETDAIRPVDDAMVDATIEHCSWQAAAVVLGFRVRVRSEYGRTRRTKTQRCGISSFHPPDCRHKRPRKHTSGAESINISPLLITSTE